jgi:two-component system response regulator
MIAQHSGRPFVVLMADDDEDDVELVSEALAEGEFLTDFRSVPDGYELIEYLHRRGGYADPAYDSNSPGSFLYLDPLLRIAPTPDLILLDLNMPKRNGTDVLRELKCTPAISMIPVVVFSTSVAERDRRKTLSLGAERYITKPSDFDTLCDMTQMFKSFYPTLQQYYHD